MTTSSKLWIVKFGHKSLFFTRFFERRSIKKSVGPREENINNCYPEFLSESFDNTSYVLSEKKLSLILETLN